MQIQAGLKSNNIHQNQLKNQQNEHNHSKRHSRI